MKFTLSARLALLASTAISFGIGGQAFAQGQAQANPATSGALEEVVVTSTRQASTVNRVPLSVSAVTQQSLDQQGIKTVADLQRSVPALQFTRDSAGSGNFAIRGIISNTGAATTGIYLDDTPLQKRRVNGGGNAANGAPTPPLFDLERVEVLRGPQGTLYGGSSEGGTIRFITPSPSLTSYSAYARAELSHVDSGEAGYEAGLAVGGPIVRDKLGFRASVFGKHTAGYVDIVDPYHNGAVLYPDSNSQETKVGRLALAWAPTDRSRVTGSIYHSEVKDHGGPDLWLQPQPAGKTYTTPATCYDTRVPGVAGALPPRTACPAAPLPAYIYQRPAQNYGPFDYLTKPYQSFVQGLSPGSTKMDIASLTIDYQFDHMSFKSITSYIHDDNEIRNRGNQELRNQQFTSDFPAAVGFPLFAPNPKFDRVVVGSNRRYGMTEEMRFASEANATPFNWVAGAYYSNLRGHSIYDQLPADANGTLTRLAQVVFGRATAQDAFGAPEIFSAATRNQTTVDTEVAGFADGGYMVTDKLKILAGVRWSRSQFNYYQFYFGTLNGWIDPYTAPQGVVRGTVTESPITPRFGAQYQLTPNDLLYVTAAKGYRTGGVNTIILANLCGPTLANLGLTVNDVPTTFGSDTIWSYEAGEKFRLFNGRVQLNSSAYIIDWSNLQLTVPNLGGGCGGGWVQNAGKARSQGFDLDFQARPFPNLTLTAAVGYTKAEYTEQASLPKPLNGAPATVIVRKGDPLPIPPWQVNLGVQYDMPLSAKVRTYARVDYTYSSSYLRGTAPGVTGYAADTAFADSAGRVNLRVGARVNGLDLSLFANNVLNSKDALATGGGRTGCSTATGAACTSFTGYDPFLTVSYGRPREIGAQVSYRY